MKEDWLGSHIAGYLSRTFVFKLLSEPFKKKIKPRLLANGVLQAGSFIVVCRANGCKLFSVKNETDYKVRDVVFIFLKLE